MYRESRAATLSRKAVSFPPEDQSDRSHGGFSFFVTVFRKMAVKCLSSKNHQSVMPM